MKNKRNFIKKLRNKSLFINSDHFFFAFYMPNYEVCYIKWPKCETSKVNLIRFQNYKD